MKKGTYTRKYLWTTAEGKRLDLYFERFASMSDRHKIGQRITVKSPLQSGIVAARTVIGRLSS